MIFFCGVEELLLNKLNKKCKLITASTLKIRHRQKERVKDFLMAWIRDNYSHKAYQR